MPTQDASHPSIDSGAVRNERPPDASEQRITDGLSWLDSRAAAAYLGGLHYKTLERYARRGQVPAYFRFHRWYFRASELDAWLKDGISSNRQFVRKN